MAMHDDAVTTETETATGTGLSRRSLVRAGATAAWSVQLIQVATSAPAFAAVSGPAKLVFQRFTAIRNDRMIRVSIQLRNTGASDTGPVTVVVRVPKAQDGQKPPVRNGVTGGWKYVSRTGNGPWDFTFISKQGVKKNALTPALNFGLVQRWSGRWKPMTITATAFAQGSPATASSTTVK